MADFSLSDIKALMGDGDANGIVWVLLIVLLIHDTNVHYSECYAKVKYMHDAYNK